ncbi:unnamed protein product [Rhodiola kirilowii]
MQTRSKRTYGLASNNETPAPKSRIKVGSKKKESSSSPSSSTNIKPRTPTKTPTKTPIRAMENQEPHVLDERVLRDYVTPNLTGFRSPIAPPAVAAHQFDLKSALINMVTANAFTGLGNPNTHLASFLELCDTFKINNVPKEAIYLRLFPFSLMGKAKEWLWSHEPGTFTTWEDLAQAVLLQYFQPGKTAKLRSLINTFAQRDGETFYEAWERYKELQRSCPHHNLDKWTLIHNFYGGMDSEARNQMDQAAGGAIMDLLPIDGGRIIEKIARNSHLWGNERSYPKRHGGTQNVSPMESNEEVRAISKKLDALVSSLSKLQMGQAQQQPQVVCSICSSSSHLEDLCPHNLPYNKLQNVEDVNYMGEINVALMGPTLPMPTLKTTKIPHTQILYIKAKLAKANQEPNINKGRATQVTKIKIVIKDNSRNNLKPHLNKVHKMNPWLASWPTLRQTKQKPHKKIR